MWELIQIIIYGHVHQWETITEGDFLVTRCTRCGKVKSTIRASKECAHKWETIRQGNLVSSHDPHGVPTGHYYDQQCEHCGEFKRVTLRS